MVEWYSTAQLYPTFLIKSSITGKIYDIEFNKLWLEGSPYSLNSQAMHMDKVDHIFKF